MGDEFQYRAAMPDAPRQSGEQEAREITRNRQHWDEAVREKPINRLRYYDALLARPAFREAGERERIKPRVAELVRELGAAVVLSDPAGIGVVRELFGEKGVQRLKQRASIEQAKLNVVAGMAGALHQRGAV